MNMTEIKSHDISFFILFNIEHTSTDSLFMKKIPKSLMIMQL